MKSSTDVRVRDVNICEHYITTLFLYWQQNFTWQQIEYEKY